MTWFLIMVWVGVAGGPSISAPTTLGPFPTRDSCEAAIAQVIGVYARAGSSPLARFADLATAGCIEVRP